MRSEQARRALRECRVLLLDSGLRQSDIAPQLGWSSEHLSRVLNGHKAMPEDFPEKFRAALVAAGKAKHERALEAAHTALEALA